MDPSVLEKLGMIIPNVHFRSEIDAFAKAPGSADIPADSVLFVGDSDFRRWDRASGFDDSFAGLPVINRGFGGARTWETLIYFDELVVPLRPKVIVYCCGDNDIACLKDPGSKNAEIGFRLFAERVATHVPSVKSILYFAIHPSPCDEPLWPFIARANESIRKYCAAASSRIEFVDYLHLLLDSRSRPRPEMFVSDNLHFSNIMYRQLGTFLRPKIEAALASY